MTLGELITQLRQLEAEGFGDSNIKLRINCQPWAGSWEYDFFAGTAVDAAYFDGTFIVIEA